MTEQRNNLTDSDHRSGDGSVLRRIESGQSDAATDLYWKYAHRIRGLAREQIGDALAERVEPDDIVQSVFRTFFRRVSTGEHYDVPAGGEIWGLFLVMALNKIRATARYHNRDKRSVERTKRLSDVPEVGDTRDLDLEVLKQVVDEVISGLPEMHRDVVSLRIEGYAVSDIASKTGLSKRTTERVLNRFRKKMAAEVDLDLGQDA